MRTRSVSQNQIPCTQENDSRGLKNSGFKLKFKVQKNTVYGKRVWSQTRDLCPSLELAAYKQFFSIKFNKLEQLISCKQNNLAKTVVENWFKLEKN